MAQTRAQAIVAKSRAQAIVAMVQRELGGGWSFLAPKTQLALCHGALLMTLCQRDYAGSHKTAAELHAEMDALRREIEQLIDPSG